MGDKQLLFKMIPKVDEILEEEVIKEILDRIPREIVLESIREELDYIRNGIKAGRFNEESLGKNLSALNNRIAKKSEYKNSFKLKRVINGTGVVIHTNIGRSLVSDQVMDNVRDVAVNYSNLEFDLATGGRGLRYDHLEYIITRITGAESAIVVNNNAAAVMLVLSTMAKDKEVIVSRGEMIEIGGAFRIPDVMEQSGARLVEIGTTNKTHLEDYERAVTEDTGALLKVHTSNYKIVGFSSAVEAEELQGIKNQYNIPIIEDLGSGVLIDLSQYGLEYEPTVQDSIRNGIDVVTFSGDKLLGGPQAGIIVGKKEYIDEMKKNPLTRAFRIDKFTISALEATLMTYLEQDPVSKIPTLNMLAQTEEEILVKAEELLNLLEANIKRENIEFTIVDDYSEVGGGSLPLEKLASKCIKIDLKNCSISKFDKGLRLARVPLITRLYKDSIFIDLRTIRRDEFNLVVESIDYALSYIEEC